jgi:TetR/AcrR family transcriptional regulator, transcriptional repressor for nem operon
MARPKEFNTDEALLRAVGLFCRQGYAATSTDELMQVMGVSRQSMYDTFGDKRALFLQALESYVTHSVQSLRVELEKPGPPLSALTNALVAFAERKDMASAEGCMGLNAASEFGQRDPEVTRILRTAARSQIDVVLRLLTSARERGELDPEVDIDSAADFFEATLTGIRMAAKAGKARKALRNIALLAGRALRHRGG